MFYKLHSGIEPTKCFFIGDKTYLPPDTFAITYRLRKSPVTPKEEQEILREYPYGRHFRICRF